MVVCGGVISASEYGPMPRMVMVTHSEPEQDDQKNCEFIVNRSMMIQGTPAFEVTLNMMRPATL